MVMPNNFKTVCVFAGYARKGIVPETTVYYLRELRKLCRDLIVVFDNDLSKEQENKIKKYSTHLYANRHNGYDFGSYKIGFEYASKHGILNDADELILCNDSCYGPIFSLEKCFERMRQRKVDFWGMVESYEEVHHILSFFYVFSKNLIRSIDLTNLICGIRKLDNYWDYVYKYERTWTRELEKKGYKDACLVTLTPQESCALSWASGTGNLTVWPKFLIEKGMPFVKVKCFNNGFGNDLMERPEDVLKYISCENAELFGYIKKDLVRQNCKCVTYDDWMKQIDGHEIISFDVFDTLLIRPFAKPSDLFLYIENIEGDVGFCEARKKAEAFARRFYSNQKDVNLNQIYDCITPVRYKSYKNIELQYEGELLKSNPAILDKYKYARAKNKKIIAVSDMYLPSDFIGQVLRKNGIIVDNVFVSNEIGEIKSGGDF